MAQIKPPPQFDRKGPALWIALGLAAYLAALLFYRVAQFPGLHGDEAWIGMFSISTLGRGLFSIQEMNAYTGALFGWLLALVFKLIGPSFAALRLPGVILNTAAAILIGLHFYRRIGPAAALAWMYLLATSSMFLWHARVAWEVCALQPLLLSATLIMMDGFLTREDFSFRRVLIFLYVQMIGIHNHFIFLSVPVSLVVFSSLSVSLRGERKLLPLLRLSCIALLMGSVLFFVHPALTRERWTEHRLWIGPLLALLPLFFTWLYRRTARIDAALKRATRFFSKGVPRTAAAGLTGLGLVAFAIWHGAPIVQIWSNVLIFKRICSWAPAWWLSIPLHVWAAFLLTLTVGLSVRSLKPDAYKTLSPYERFLVFWPLAYCAFFIAFRHTSSVRYYIPASFILMTSAAYALSRAPILRRTAILVPMLGVAVVLNGLYWKEMSAPWTRHPFRFNIGWRLEVSSGFMPKTPIYEMMVREGVCRFDQKNSFIDLPLFFYRATHQFPCDDRKTFHIRYCPECTRPPYFTWTIRTEEAGT